MSPLRRGLLAAGFVFVVGLVLATLVIAVVGSLYLAGEFGMRAAGDGGAAVCIFVVALVWVSLLVGATWAFDQPEVEE